jgi:hypothetical protein
MNEWRQAYNRGTRGFDLCTERFFWARRTLLSHRIAYLVVACIVDKKYKIADISDQPRRKLRR